MPVYSFPLQMRWVYGYECPRPVVYDDATLKAIQQSLSDLPLDSILRSVMHDYEMERDDLRFCR